MIVYLYHYTQRNPTKLGHSPICFSSERSPTRPSNVVYNKYYLSSDNCEIKNEQPFPHPPLFWAVLVVR